MIYSLAKERYKKRTIEAVDVGDKKAKTERLKDIAERLGNGIAESDPKIYNSILYKILVYSFQGLQCTL